MILKRLLIGAAGVLFGVLVVLLLAGDAGYLMYGTLGGWGFILVGLSTLVGKPKRVIESQHSVITRPEPPKLYIEPGLHDMLSDEELAAIKARFTEIVRRKEPLQILETWDARVRLIEQAALHGTISQKTAGERYSAMLREWYDANSPMNQLYTLSSEYGLPVETPVQKQSLPVLAAAPQDEPDDDDDVPTVEESLDGYVPEGQDDLTRDLKAYLHRQVADARKTPFTAGRKREWHVGPEWAEEVRRLPAFTPCKPVGVDLVAKIGTLNGYPVLLGEPFGTPELTAI